MSNPSTEEYPATTLSVVKRKYYVSCTIPKELRSKFNGRVQIKRSTGTSDLSIAKRRQHSITTEIYAEFVKANEPEPVSWYDLIRPYVQLFYDEDEEALKASIEDDPGQWISHPYIFQSDEKRRELRELFPGGRLEEKELALQHLKSPEWARIMEKAEGIPYPNSNDDGGKGPFKLKLSELREEYLLKYLWRRTSTKSDFANSISKFIEDVGDIPVVDLKAGHAYAFAQRASDAGAANKTISKRITAIRSMLEYGVRTGKLDSNPLTGIRLSAYGTKSQRYRAIEQAELQKLFSLEMPDREKVVLSLLVSTGARLDEIALLRCGQIKTSDQGFTYLDIRDATVKTEGSKRLVPLHPKVAPILSAYLGSKTEGNVFDYPRGRDGKAWNSASVGLNRLIKKATGKALLKVVHSLRGTFKDMLRDKGISKEMNDFLTGHSSGDVAGTYGSGPSLQSRYEAICSLKLDFL